MKETRIFIFALLAVIAVNLFPYLWLGTSAYVTIHDCLDGELVYYHLLKITGLLYSFDPNAIVPNVMNGLPRVFFHSEFSFIRLLFYCFPSFWAYVINSVIVRAIGFTGMYLFTRDHLLKEKNTKISIVFAVMFSLMPTYPLYGLSLMGLPILMWAFLNLNNGSRKFVNWLVILLFPFYVHFALIAPFVLFAVTVYGIYIWIKKGRARSRYYSIGSVLLFGSFILANYQSLQNFISPGNYVSHRTEWMVEPLKNFDGIKRFFYTIIYGQYHSASFNSLPIYLFAAFSLYLVKFERRKMRNLAIPFILIVAISLLEASYSWLCYISRDSLHILTVFHFNRFTFFIPVLWFIIFGMSIHYAGNKIKPVILYFTIIIQFLLLVRQNEELKYNYGKVLIHYNKQPGFDDYYAPSLFKQVSNYINQPKDQYRIVSIGMPPSVTQYNGFYTLDSYQNNYPLSYKHTFRKIIEKELDKNPLLKKHFDYWGSRCYVFSEELMPAEYWNCTKNKGMQIDSLDINTTALKQLGGNYILSAAPVLNYDKLQLQFLGKFSDTNAVWDIYLYKL